MNKKKLYLLITIYCIIMSCNNQERPSGTIERIDPSLDSIINPAAKVEIIAEGFEWSEGPLWVSSQQMLLFSDVPKNTIYKWTEDIGAEIYLEPSGYTDTIQRGGETGSNGLVMDRDGRLVLCQHGDRRMARMDAPLDAPKPAFTTLADNFQGKKFNSPNDAVYRSNGDLFFTDPPYGLEKNIDDPLKEIPFQGVYLVKSTGDVLLISDSISRPNGIGLTPDEKTLIVANSDGDNPVWYAFELSGDSVVSKRIFHDASEAPIQEKGGPDGFKIDKKGNMFATGPGGVWIFNSRGKLAGKIKFPEACSNTALSGDEKTLFITADMYVLRVKMK
jgi:gluconolactonase